MTFYRGFTVWFTGLSGSGKTTLSQLVYKYLQESGTNNIEVLDGDIIRTHLSKGLGFSKEDRYINLRRIGWVAQLLTKHKVPNLVAAISPYQEIRDEVRKMVEDAGGKGSFVEVFVDCPLEVCKERDPKGLYARAMRGEIKDFTGITHPYEPPIVPEVHITTNNSTPEECANKIFNYIESRELIEVSQNSKK
jgi:adenylyl-sulfate kinase